MTVFLWKYYIIFPVILKLTTEKYSSLNFIFLEISTLPNSFLVYGFQAERTSKSMGDCEVINNPRRVHYNNGNIIYKSRITRN